MNGGQVKEEIKVMFQRILIFETNLEVFEIYSAQLAVILLKFKNNADHLKSWKIQLFPVVCELSLSFGFL